MVNGLHFVSRKIEVSLVALMITVIFVSRYTLLVGHPPFETQSLKETYTKIKKNEYHIPSRIGTLARNLIIKMLQADPSAR